MDRLDCGCVSNRKEKTESKATAQKQFVYVTVPPNPEETVEVMKLVSQERASCRCASSWQRSGSADHGSKRQLHRSQQQQQHQAVHEEKEEERKEKERARRTREREGQDTGRKRGGTMK